MTYLLAQAQGGGGGLMGMLFIIVPMFIIMYVITIRPQQKRQREHQELLRRLKVGDKVVTSGGIHGTIAGVKDATFLIKVADNTKIEVSRGSVVTVLDEAGNDVAATPKK